MPQADKVRPCYKSIDTKDEFITTVRVSLHCFEELIQHYQKIITLFSSLLTYEKDVFDVFVRSRL